MSEEYQWPNTYAFLHYPFLIIENKNFVKPKWYPGYIRPILGYKMYEKKFRDDVIFSVYENGMFAFDFTKHSKLKSKKGTDFELSSKIMSQRVEYMNAFLLCLEMAILKKLKLSLGSIMLADPNNLISIKGSGYGWGGDGLIGMLLEKHGLDIFKDEEQIKIDTTRRHKIDVSILFHAARKFNQILKVDSSFPKVDLVALSESLIRAAISLSQHVYDQALTNTWVVIEVSINQLWSDFLKDRTIVGARKDGMESSNWTISHKQETLHLSGRLNKKFNDQIHALRTARNKLVHEGQLKDGLEWNESIKLAQDLMRKAFNLDLELPVSRSLHG